MIGKNQRAGLADAQPFTRRDAALLQHGQLFQQGRGREHHAVADETLDVLAQDARGNQVQHRFPAVNDQRMTGVVATLETHHGGRPVGQQIDHLALAFITPLGPDDHDIFSHGIHSHSEVFEKFPQRHAG